MLPKLPVRERCVLEAPVALLALESVRLRREKLQPLDEPGRESAVGVAGAPGVGGSGLL